MFNLLRYIGVLLLLPGLCALGYSVYQGPGAWAVDSGTFWGTPISLFVFWIGLAHAGTLLSAIFLALDIKMDKRTAMMAELSTLCSLAIAVIFPLMHLGVIDRFYMVLPLADAREGFSNIRSPLVWDFCCIGVYGVLSLVFFATHLAAKTFSGLKKIRKPLAWLLFPLVLWVHTVVSLDFAASFVPEWAGAFFPVYFIVGAVYSGIALVCCILWFEGYRMRMLEKLLMISSWIICAIWLWNFAAQRTFCTSAFIFAGLLPQLYWVESIRETRIGRICIYLSVLLGLWLERLFLVSPNLGTTAGASFGWVDLGLIAFSAGAFILALLLSVAVWVLQWKAKVPSLAKWTVPTWRPLQTARKNRMMERPRILRIRRKINMLNLGHLWKQEHFVSPCLWDSPWPHSSAFGVPTS